MATIPTAPEHVTVTVASDTESRAPQNSAPIPRRAIVGVIGVVVVALALGWTLILSQDGRSESAPSGTSTGCSQSTAGALEFTTCAYDNDSVKVAVYANGLVINQALLTPRNNTFPLRGSNSNVRVEGRITGVFPADSVTDPSQRVVALKGEWTARVPADGPAVDYKAVITTIPIK